MRKVIPINHGAAAQGSLLKLYGMKTLLSSRTDSESDIYLIFNKKLCITILFFVCVCENVHIPNY